MHSADSGTHLSQRREKLLHLLRIPHDHRKRYRANLLYSAERFRLRASPRTSAPHRRPPSLRKPFQEVASMKPSRRSFLEARLALPTLLGSSPSLLSTHPTSDPPFPQHPPSAPRILIPPK